MNPFSRISGFFRKNTDRAYSASAREFARIRPEVPAAAFLPLLAGLERLALQHAPGPEDTEGLRLFLKEKCGGQAGGELFEKLHLTEPPTDAEHLRAAALAMADVKPEAKRELLGIVLSFIPVKILRNEAFLAAFRTAAENLDLGPEAADEALKADDLRREGRFRIAATGAGLAVALVIILLFGLAAAFLKVVFFGFLVAYFFLPVERFYEKIIFRGVVGRAMDRFFAVLFWPLRKLRSSLEKRGIGPHSKTEAERERARNNALAGKAAGMTVLTVIVLSILLTTIGISFLTKLTKSTSSDIFVWLKDHDWFQKIEKNIEHAVNGTDRNGEIYRIRVDQDAPQSVRPENSQGQYVAVESSDGSQTSVPVSAAPTELKPIGETDAPSGSDIRAWGKEKFFTLLRNNSLEWVGSLFSGGAGILSILVNILVTLGTFAFDLLMFFFFFFFFLQRMAVVRISLGKKAGKSSTDIADWTVKAITKSAWLPGMDENTRKVAADIMSRIYRMFDAWIRGYFWIIIVETVLYMTCFTLFQVPYAIPLALVAGCTILLPFIGPVLSFLLSAGVVLIFAGGEMALPLVGICISYLLINGLLEQLFLYPCLVGEAIGLTTIETIIVVLLGAVLAGIMGMILAVPVAALLKLLVPLFYEVVNPGKHRTGSEPAEK